MRTRDDIEAYLTRAALPFRELAEDGTMWLVRDTGWGEHVVVTMAGPLVLFRMKITTLAAMATSSIGSVKPLTPMTAPAASAAMKVAGPSQARPAGKAWTDQRPTATIASR